jgi:hypothetical protein
MFVFKGKQFSSITVGRGAALSRLPHLSIGVMRAIVSPGLAQGKR